MFTLSYARDGSPLIFMTPSKNNTDPSPRQVKNTMFVIERAVDLMRRDVELVKVHNFRTIFPRIDESRFLTPAAK